MHKAVGSQLTCFFIDRGLLRGEREQVENDYARGGMGIRVIVQRSSLPVRPGIASRAGEIIARDIALQGAQAGLRRGLIMA